MYVTADNALLYKNMIIKDFKSQNFKIYPIQKKKKILIKTAFLGG